MLHETTFPNESSAYRAARNKLLEREQALRTELEEIARERRALPAGGNLKEDYVFQAVDLSGQGASEISFSALFGDKDSLLVYSYMFGPDWDDPCPSCTSVIDGLDAMSRHVRRQVELVVVGKASPQQLHAIAEERGWRDIRLLSSEHNDYTRDYRSQLDAGTQSLIPIMNSFHRDGDEIRHHWASEMFWTPLPGGHPRHVDIVWPLWGLLDLARAGRHPDMGPKLRY